MIQKHCFECGTALIEKELEEEGIVPYCPKCQQYRFPMYNVAVSMIVVDEETGKIRKEEFEQFIFSAMQEKFKDFQILHGKEEKVNPKLTAYQVELAQVEAEIEKLLDTLTGANATLLAYANKKIEELDTRRQTISKAIAELSVETISPQQIKKLSYYLDNWESIDFDDKRKAADGLISTIKATSDRVQIEWKI